MPLQRCQQETTSSEFVKWMAYLERDANAFHRQDYYLAQIALEVRRIFAKHPNKMNLDDFILKFEQERKKIEKQTSNVEERSAKMLNYWKSVVEG